MSGINNNDFRNKLSIYIPTYNRDIILKETLDVIVPLVKNYNIPIIIIDNCSNDNTKKVIEDSRCSYNLIKYIRNDKNIGGDNNILKCYTISETEYTWVLGDSYTFTKETIINITKIINEKKPDLLVLNRNNKIINNSNQIIEYNNYIDFLKDLGASIDLISILIVKNDNEFSQYALRYTGTRFYQVVIIIESLIKKEHPLVIYCPFSDVLMTKLNKISTSWWGDNVEIFARNWTITIFSLPWQIPIKIKEKIIFDHSKLYGGFRIHDIIIHKINGTLNCHDFIKYKKYLPFATNTNIIAAFIIKIIPKSIFRIVIYIKLKVMNRCYPKINNSDK